MPCIKIVTVKMEALLSSCLSRKFLKELAFYGTFYRFCSSKSKYSDTVILPVTSFPVRIDGKKRVEHDAMILKSSKIEELYDWQSIQPKDKVFVLHDGPPYANGPPHIGHAVNKILKDITNRYKLLRGYKIHYVPGWDCHGLPIEHKALSAENRHESNSALPTINALEVRKQARTFAKRSSQVQMQSFRQWGVMANWNKCYFTFNKDYIARQLQVFYQLYEKGFVYRDFKPVFWSYSTRTALAEAELEYNANHISPAVYFKCKVKKLAVLVINEPVYALVWTTAPWTIPSNQAICFSSDTRYLIVKSDDYKGNLLIASEIKDQLEQTLQTHFEVLKEFEGSMLISGTYSHPLTGDERPFLSAKHVTMAKGSGLVHIAPAHGPEDFLVALENKLPIKCFVDEDARFTDELGPELNGKFVLKEGNEKVIQLLGDSVLFVESFVHKYPYDWRSKQPVILRASKQWFIDTNNIKEDAIRCIKDITVYPDIEKTRMISQLENRPYWCISRQRVWGVPIPVFYESVSNNAVINKITVDHLVSLLHRHGSDFWWQLPDEALLPLDVIRQSGLDIEKSYQRGTDILDIWFDSGSSWASVLSDQDGVADVFLEGKDQIGGWFQSTLLTSCALRKKAPYKTLYVHGFTLDEEGRKMSKSLGNVVDPAIIISGGKHFTKDPPYGVDTLRWWVACHASGSEDVPVGPKVLKQSAENVQKVRSILRYLLGILHQFEPEQDAVSVENMLHLDRYMLHQLFHFKNQIIDAYDSFLYNKVGNTILKFITNDVSALYCHLVKDRLYCEERNGIKRRSCLTVINLVLETLLLAVAPVLPFLCEEVYQHHPRPLMRENQFFQTTWSSNDDDWLNEELAQIMICAFRIRQHVNQHMTLQSLTNKNFDITIYATGQIYDQLKVLQDDKSSNSSSLCEILQTAEVKLENECPAAPLANQLIHEYDDSKTLRYSMMLTPTTWNPCPRCRRCASEKRDCLCMRCSKVLQR